jgi:hypothetical protein
VKDTIFEDFFPHVIAKDFFMLFAGKRLGSGYARTVYEHALDPTLVIKIETTAKSFQNVQEYDTWQEVKDTRFSKWFAPCMSISSCGIILIQKKAEDLHSINLPKMVPEFLTDLHIENWGIYKGKPVCRDYGLTRLKTIGMSKKLKKADWY